MLQPVVVQQGQTGGGRGGWTCLPCTTMGQRSPNGLLVSDGRLAVSGYLGDGGSSIFCFLSLRSQGYTDGVPYCLLPTRVIMSSPAASVPASPIAYVVGEDERALRRRLDV